MPEVPKEAAAAMNLNTKAKPSPKRTLLFMAFATSKATCLSSRPETLISTGAVGRLVRSVHEEFVRENAITYLSYLGRCHQVGNEVADVPTQNPGTSAREGLLPDTYGDCGRPTSCKLGCRGSRLTVLRESCIYGGLGFENFRSFSATWGQSAGFLCSGALVLKRSRPRPLQISSSIRVGGLQNSDCVLGSTV